MAVGPLIAAAGYLLMTMVDEPFNFWTQMLPGLVVFGLGLSITVSPLTAAILAAVDPAQSGIGSAINNAVSRIAGLIAVAFTGVIIGGTIDFGGFRQGALVVAGLFGIAGIISAVGIRNDEVRLPARLSRNSAAPATTGRPRRRRTPTLSSAGCGCSSSSRSSSSTSAAATNSSSSPPSSGSSDSGTITRGPRRMVTSATSRGSSSLRTGFPPQGVSSGSVISTRLA